MSITLMRSSRVPRRLLLLVLCTLPGLLAGAQKTPPIPARHVRIHYFNPGNNYAGWTVYAFGDTTESQGGYNDGPVQIAGRDSFGAYFDVGITPRATKVGIIIHHGNLKDPGPNEYIDPATQGNEYWQISGQNGLTSTQPSLPTGNDPPLPSGHARIHYHRSDGGFAGWTLYPSLATTDATGSVCTTEDYIAGYDAYGAYYDVGVKPSANGGQLGFMIHNCGNLPKDSGPDQHLQIDQYKEAWVISGDSTVYTKRPTAAQRLKDVFQEQQAYWLDRTRIAIQPQYLQTGSSYALHWNLTGGFQVTDHGVADGNEIPLVPGGPLNQDDLAHFPQLSNYAVLAIPESVPLTTIAQALKGQMAISVVAQDGTLIYATGIQALGALDSPE